MTATEVAPAPTPNKALIKLEHLGRWCAGRRGMEVPALLLRALHGGTPAMRDMGPALLPPDFRERRKPEIYADRLERSVLFPGYVKAVSDIAARPFQEAVKLKEADGLPEELKKLETDCDRQGLDLTSFARGRMRVLADRSITLWLVDNPPTPTKVRERTGEERTPNLSDAERLDLRPYFVKVHPDDIIDWAWRYDEGSKKRHLAYIQIFDETPRTDPKTGDEKLIQTIRFWTETEWQVWEREVPIRTAPNATSDALVKGPTLATLARQKWSRSQNDPQGGSTYAMVDGAKHQLGEIPLVIVNVDEESMDPLVAHPALFDLAWLNIEHWQSSSQQRNVLHFARAPMLFGAGFPDKFVEGTEQLVLGAGASTFSKDPNAKLSYVEPQFGTSIEAGERDLKAIEDRMTLLGMAPLMQAEGAPNDKKTATGVAADEMRTQSTAQSWVEALEWGLWRAYELAAKWIGAKLPENFSVGLFRDIGILARSQQDLDALDKARTRGDIPRTAFVEELIRRKVLPRDYDVEAAEAELEDEAQTDMDKFMQETKATADASAKAKAAMGPPGGMPPKKGAAA